MKRKLLASLLALVLLFTAAGCGPDSSGGPYAQNGNSSYTYSTPAMTANPSSTG